MIDTNTQRMLARDAQLCSDDDQTIVSIRTGIENALKEVHTCCPGIIDTFDVSEQTVKVKPAIQKLFYPDGEDARWVDLPPLVDVPVVTMSGAGFALTFPIQSGDACLLLFSDTAIDNWVQNGESSEPPSLRRHSLSDAFALVGIHPRNQLIQNYNADDMELRSEDGRTRIRITNSDQINIEQGDNQIQMGGGEIKLTAPTVRIEGQLSVSGTIAANGDVTGGGISLQHHIHSGVQGGGSVTGPPQ